MYATAIRPAEAEVQCSGANVRSQGLMLARMRGARAARGSVLVFLDAHCEANADWLRPLLQRVKEKRDAVLTPLIDVVDQTSFHLDAAQNFQVPKRATVLAWQKLTPQLAKRSK